MAAAIKIFSSTARPLKLLTAAIYGANLERLTSTRVHSRGHADELPRAWCCGVLHSTLLRSSTTAADLKVAAQLAV